tara:strand:- start:9745 stop:10023 length:279 start_codon:yes stop_codon:yes gene_type:complete
MSWKNILKMLLPRQFMEHFAFKLGLEADAVKGGHGKAGIKMFIDFGDRRLELLQRGRGGFTIFIRENSMVVERFTNFNLEKLLEPVEEALNL